MVLTKEVSLPQFKELNVKEVDVSTATLMSAAPYLGKCCEAVNNEFMLCRIETKDPRVCLELGKRVTACTLEFFKKLKKNCCKEFNQYANCIEKSSGDFTFRYCRKTQAIFDACMLDQLFAVRPHYGHFCRPRVHNSNSSPPPAPPCPCHPKVQDATPSLPDCKPRYPARFTSRNHWITE